MFKFTYRTTHNHRHFSFVTNFFTHFLPLISLCGFCFVFILSSSTNANAAPPQIVFNALLIIKVNTAIPKQGSFPGANATMTQNQINGITRSFSIDFPYWIQTITNNRVAIAPKVIVSSTPLKTLEYPDWVGIGPNDVQTELKANLGTNGGGWDAVFVYTNIENKGQLLSHYGGLTEGAIPGLSRWVGFTSLYTTYADNFNVNGLYGTEGFIHEWMHQLEAYYGSTLGVPMPYCPPPGSSVSDFPAHCGGILPQYGNGVADKLLGWKKYYKDFLNGKVKDANQNIRGLGETAWVKGTPAGSFNTSPPRAIPIVTDAVPATFWRQTIEAESTSNSMSSGAIVYPCSFCSKGAAVEMLGNNRGALNVNNFSAHHGGNYQLNISYINGDSTPRSGWLFLDGVYLETVNYPSSKNWSTVATVSVDLQVTMGSHWLQFWGPKMLPNIDKVDFIE